MYPLIKKSPLAIAILLSCSSTPLIAAPDDKLGAEFLVNTTTAGSQHESNIAMDADGDFVITWTSRYQDGSNYGVYARSYRANGSTTDAEFLVNTYTADNQNKSSIAMDADGDFIIAWSSIDQDGDLRGVYAQRYEGNGGNGGNASNARSSGGNGVWSGFSLLLFIPLWLSRRLLATPKRSL